MLLEELIGKKITNIYQILQYEEYGLDKGECFVELDSKIIIDIPYGFDDEVTIKNMNDKARSAFADLSDYPIYHLSNEEEPIKGIEDKYPAAKPIFWEKIKFLLGFRKMSIVQAKATEEYKSYKIEYVENKLKYIKDCIIKDIISYGDDDEKVFLELDNGYLISETNFSMNGTGRIGVNIYYNINEVTNWKGNNFKRISDRKK